MIENNKHGFFIITKERGDCFESSSPITFETKNDLYGFYNYDKDKNTLDIIIHNYDISNSHGNNIDILFRNFIFYYEFTRIKDIQYIIKFTERSI